MGGERLGWARAAGFTEHELVCLFAAAEHDLNLRAVGEELGLAHQTVKNHLHSCRQRLGTRTTLTAYHRLVRGVRFETIVTTRMVVEEG